MKTNWTKVAGDCGVAGGWATVSLSGGDGRRSWREVFGDAGKLEGSPGHSGGCLGAK